MSFKEVSLKILEDSKEYNDNIQDIFEVVFGVFMETIQISQESGELTNGQIKSRVFNKLFGPMKNDNTKKTCNKPKIQNELLEKLTNNETGFDPNSNGIDMNLLGKLKQNINKVRKQDLKDNFKKIKRDFEKE